MAAGVGSREPAQDAVIRSARSGEPDRYLSALLAPRSVRGDLIAVAAFAAELGRVGALTREPAMADIRLQWWRDALELPAPLATGNPIADALRDAMVRHRISSETLAGVIDAHAHDADLAPFADDAALYRHLERGEGALFFVSARMLDPQSGGTGLASVCTAAGRAYGLSRLLFALRASFARGRVPLPQARLEAAGIAARDLRSGARPDVLVRLVRDLAAEARDSSAHARRAVGALPGPPRIAFHPLALVEPYLRSAERAMAHSPAHVAEIAPLTRLLRIARAHWLGRL